MDNVYLYRISSGDSGTKGLWLAPGFNCKSIELPWRDNKKSISCIPDGIYLVKIRHSKKYGWIYHITGVDGRTWILTHAGNWAGDIKKGYKSNSQGCILLGKYFATIYGQSAVALSKPTLRRFMSHMQNEPFNLIIESVYMEVA